MTPSEIMRAIAQQFAERAKALGYKGKRADNAALDYVLGAASGARLAGNEEMAQWLERWAAMAISVRGMFAIREVIERRD